MTEQIKIKMTFDIYIPDTAKLQAIELESFITKYGGIPMGMGYALNYFNLFGYANDDLLPALSTKCKENKWYFNEHPPEIKAQIED